MRTGAAGDAPAAMPVATASAACSQNAAVSPPSAGPQNAASEAPAIGTSANATETSRSSPSFPIAVTATWHSSESFTRSSEASPGSKTGCQPFASVRSATSNESAPLVFQQKPLATPFAPAPPHPFPKRASRAYHPVVPGEKVPTGRSLQPPFSMIFVPPIQTSAESSTYLAKE